MTHKFQFLIGRVRRLADSLTLLRDQVRHAVAAQLAKAFGQAVHDLVPEVVRTFSLARRPDDEWDDEPPLFEPDLPASARFPVALAVAASFVKWWLARGGPPWIAAGLGLIAGIAGWCGGPLVRAVVRVVVLAADLIHHTDIRDPDDDR